MSTPLFNYRRITLFILSALTWQACADPPPYKPYEDGEPCGPCGLGTYTAQPIDQCGSPLAAHPDVLVIGASCEGELSAALFVDSAQGADAPGQGGKDQPLKSLPFALEQASARGLNLIIIKGDFTLEQPLKLVDGVHIIGGYREERGEYAASFYYDPKVRPKITINASETGPTLGVDATDLEAKTILANMEIITKDAIIGENIGIKALRAKQLTLQNVIVRAGAGASGVDGDDGAAGDGGSAGKTGGTVEPHLPGAPGENPACPEANGGAGGNGQIKTAQDDIPAQPGAKSPAGSPGGDPRVKGTDGQPGSDGAPGQTATLGQFRAGAWFEGQPATDGNAGRAGQGGGGGGGGEVLTGQGRGGGGGGGGAGGCGGQGGARGTSGSPSVALLVEAANVTLADATQLIAGQGGDAGKGGQGGAHGEGKRGGVGGGGTDIPYAGAGGGAGNNGGDGGDGGDGVAGPSYGAYCIDKGQLKAQGKDNTFKPGRGGLEVDQQARAQAQETSGCTLSQ